MKRRLSLRVLVVTAGLLLFSSVALATLVEAPGTYLFGPKTVWTDGTSTPTFHPLSRPMSSAGLDDARVSTYMDQDSGNCKIRPALRYSNDGVTWDTAKEIVASYRTTAGTDYGTSYVDLTSLTTPRAFVQFGVEAANESGGLINLCNATIRIEPKQK